jgi:hypothetical protein
MGGSVVFFVVVAFLIWHMKAAYRGETRHYLDLYQVPERGVPRLAIIARNLKLAEVLEMGIVVAFLLLYIGKTPLYSPSVEYSPDTLKWLYENALTIATLFAWMPFFGIIMWNREPGVQDKKEPVTEYKAVRPQTHNKPGLDSVNELMKGYDVDTRDF